MRSRLHAASRLPIERTATARLKRLRSGRAFGGTLRLGKLKKLPLEAKLLVHAMVHGLEEDFENIKARQPITLIDACRALGA